MDTSTNSELPPKKSSIQLIVFGSHGNLGYFDSCKIVLDAIKKILIITPNGESASSKSIIASFDQDFFKLKNIFRAFPSSASETSSHDDFILIFKSEETCKKLYENIQKRKNSNVVFCIDDEAEKRFQNHFFRRILEEIEKTEKFEAQLKEIILNFVNSLSIEERKEYLNILNNSDSKLLASESFSEFAIEIEAKTYPARSRAKILPNTDFEMDATAANSLNNETLPLEMESTLLVNHFSNVTAASKKDISLNDSTMNSTDNFCDNDRRLSLRKRPLKKLDYSFNYDIGESDSDSNVHGENPDQDGPQIKKQAFKDIYLPNDTVEPPNYEVKEYLEFGVQRKKLIVFAFEDKNLCRVYNYERSKNSFLCSKCKNNKYWVRADIISDNENGNEYVRLGKNSHICELIEYIPENYMDKEYIIIKPPNFKISHKKYGEQVFPRLTIFNCENQNLFREYSWSAINKKFYCGPCHSKNNKRRYIFAKLIENENEEPYVQLSPEEHFCEENECNFDENGEIIFTNNINRQKNVQVKEEIAPKTVKSGGFKIESFMKGENERKRLIVFDENDKTHNYIYNYFPSENRFVCKGCIKFHKRVTAKLYQSEMGEDFITLGPLNHVCNNPDNSNIIHSEFNSVKDLKDVTGKIIVQSNFKIKEFTTSNGKERRRLIIYCTEDKSLGYIYFYCKTSDYFVCDPCVKMHKRVTAQLYRNEENDQQNFVELNHEHVCEMRNVDEKLKIERKIKIVAKDKKILEKQENHEEEEKILTKENFKIESYLKDGVERKRLFIYNLNNQNSAPFKYFYDKRSNIYICSGCSWKGKHTSAKLRHNEIGEEFIELFSTKHICRSILSENSTGKIIHAEGFKIETFNRGGTERKRLIVFDENDKNLAYTYYYSKSSKAFVCNGCGANKKYIWARMHQNEAGENYLELGPNEHVCECQNIEEILKYVNKKILHENQILSKENYKIDLFTKDGIERQRLIFSDPADSTISYTYYYNQAKELFICNGCKFQNKQISAKLRQNENVEEFIELISTNHVCQNLVSVRNSAQGKIVEADGFKNEKFFKGGVHRKRLILFDEKNKNLVYTYHFSKKQKIFICNGCAKLQKPVVAKMHFDQEKEESFVELGLIQHFCEPKPKIISVENVTSIILQNTDFKIENYTNSKNLPQKRIIIPDSTNINLSYIFSYFNGKYACDGCRRLENLITAKLKNNEDGNEYLEVDDIKHNCNPIEYIPLESASKIVKAPNFKFEYYTKNGIERKMLTVFDAQNKNLCYEYYFIPERNIFTCNNCKTLGKCITAKFYENESEENYIKLSELEHVCRPQPEEKVLDSSEYKLEMGEKQNVAQISIFNPQNKNFFYEFTFYKDNRYRCHACSKKAKTSEVKLFEDEIGNFYVKTGNFEHSCQTLNIENTLSE